MIIDNPYTDLQEAYRNRARIEKMRLQEAVRLRPTLSEFSSSHYPIRVRNPNQQRKKSKNTSAVLRP